MSGFTASNSRIQVIETVGTAPNQVDQTVFDTNDDMPHIVGTSYIQNVTVDFDDLTESESYVNTVCVGDWVNVLIPGFTTYHRETTTTWNETYQQYDQVWFNYSIHYYPTWETQWDSCAYFTSNYQWSIDAEEYSNITDLTNLPPDEDGNAIDVDFVIVQATGTRSTAGKDPRFNQALPTTVPSKTFSFQGSVLLESSGKANGDSWFRRIMSVYPSNGKLKLKIQESVATLLRGAQNAQFPHVNDTRSTYSFDFKVFFGKFRQ